MPRARGKRARRGAPAGAQRFPWLVLLFLVPSAVLAGAAWEQALPSQASLVVAVVVGGREVGVAEVLRWEDEFCLRVTDFAQFSGAQVELLETAVLFKTPLGETKLGPEAVREVARERYVCQAVLRQRLDTLVSFDAATVTLTLDIPWSLAPVPVAARPLVPEIRAPRWGLGTFHWDITAVSERGKLVHTGTAWLTGRALSGEWRVLLGTGADRELVLRELLWTTRRQQWFVFAGRNYVQLSPLLPGFDLLGMGAGWSNRPRAILTWNGGNVVSLISPASRSFRGAAPVGSLVKLRINGVFVASQQVGLSGFYEFLDVPVAGGRGTLNVELEIFDRHNLLVPVEVRRFAVPASWFLLPKGALEVVGGGGAGGAFGRNLWGEDATLRKGAFFAGGRWGLSDTLTLEGHLQAVGTQPYTGLAAAWQAWPEVFTAGSIAATRGRVAWLWESVAQKGVFSLFARALQQPEGFALTGVGPGREDRSLELRWNPNSWLELGVWARELKDAQGEEAWVRPTAALALSPWLFLRAVPDQYGDYLITVTSQPHPRLRLTASAFHSRLYDLAWDLRPWELRATLEEGGVGASRLTATVGNRPAGFLAPSWRLGLIRSASFTAPFAEFSARVVAGLWLRGQYLGIPARVVGKEKPKPRIVVSLVGDFGYSTGRVLPLENAPLRRELGAVAGRLVVMGKGFKPFLGGARVQVVGVGGVVTSPDGSFFVGNIFPGVYEVELDPEKLPLELVPVQRRFVVEVVAGAVSRVDFPLRQLFGLAGQVRLASGEPVSEVPVELVRAGEKVATQRSDVFGYFRFDQLEPGDYLLRATLPDGRQATRAVRLQEFLFEQDLVVGP